MRTTTFGLGLLLLSCSPTLPPTTEVTKHQHIYDVGWTVLVRDFTTAHSYSGQRVRIRLDKDDYRVENSEILVFIADNGAPPILIIRGVEIPTRPLPPITVVATCRGPIRDGVWRNRNADFCVVMDNPVVTTR